MKSVSAVSRRLMSLPFVLLLLSLVTACAGQDQSLRRATVLEVSRPADAFTEYERVILRTPSTPAAFQARLRAAHVLADINPGRARACARLVAEGATDAQARQSAATFLKQSPSVAGQFAVSDQELCDTSNPSDIEQVKLAQERIRARNQAGSERSAAAAKAASESGAAKSSRESSASSSSGSSGSGNCHWVNGYTRKNGTRVRGHMRCR